MIIDIYTHIFPDRFFRELERGSPKLGNMGKRLRGIQKLFDLDLRFREMDELGDYRQIISLPNPPIEDIAEGEVAKKLAQVANDSMAELCARHPDRFPTFAAAVSLDDVDAAIREAECAIKTLGAGGVQIFTNIAGHPLDEPRFAPFFAALAGHDLPIWHAGLCIGGDIAVRNVVVLRLALRDDRRNGAAGLLRIVRPASEAQNHHTSSGRRNDSIF
jgi:aminocarboxymuconate-semialdehyde decarboxylase